MKNSSKTSQSSKYIQQMNWQIEQLPNLSPQDCLKLKNCGIQTTLQLLQKPAIFPQGRP
jgi:hypothetical protein